MDYLKILDFAYQKNYPEVLQLLEAVFKEDDNKIYSQKADNFIFSQDITRLLYNELFSLGYRAVLDENTEEYILSLKIIYAKLKSGHRYTYFDRENWVPYQRNR
jgi:hypothetical protein